MTLFGKAGGALSRICGIDIGFQGNAIPSSIAGYQPFYNSILVDYNFQAAYHGVSTVSFTEENVHTTAGYSWKQKLTFRFPTADRDRALRLTEFQKITYAKIKMSSGLHLLLGRNDFEQNKKPAVSISVSGTMAILEISTESVFATGYTPNFDAYGLPTFVPITLE